jgi:hypothetical protein
MPKQETMAQLSRPFQIALVAVCLLAGVWLFALQGHSSSSSSSSATPTTRASSPSSTPASSEPAQGSSSSTAAAEAHADAAPTPVYHGSAPGVHGLSSAISKAHGAVATSQQSAKQVEGESGEGASSTASASASAKAAAPAKSSAPATRASSSTSASSSSASAPSAAVPTRQQAVEAAVAKGDVAVILFWNPRGSDDKSVHKALAQVKRADHRIAVQEALASQVAAFGAVTRGVQIYATPAMLFVNKSGRTDQLNGLQDAFSIEQTIAEARHA